MSEADTIDPQRRPLTAEEIARILRSLGAGTCPVLLVHTSLSSLGWVSGGVPAVIEALLDVAGDRGTIVMPSHSPELSDPAHWENPPAPPEWWDTIRQTMPAFDPRTTPCPYMGVVANAFRSWPGVVRSDHPTASFAALGPLADQIVAEHPLEDALGERSPLARIASLGGAVLLLGVGHESNTMLHLAERRAFGERQVSQRTGSPVLRDGERQWLPYEQPIVDSDDFPALGAYLECRLGESAEPPPARMPVARRSVGRGLARLILATPMLSVAETWLLAHRTADGRTQTGASGNDSPPETPPWTCRSPDAVLCASCQYLVGDLDVTANCPECGTGVRETLAGRHVFSASQACPRCHGGLGSLADGTPCCPQCHWTDTDRNAITAAEAEANATELLRNGVRVVVSCCVLLALTWFVLQVVSLVPG